MYWCYAYRFQPIKKIHKRIKGICHAPYSIKIHPNTVGNNSQVGKDKGKGGRNICQGTMPCSRISSQREGYLPITKLPHDHKAHINV